MTDHTALAGHLLKRDACERYDRSLRQLSRDFDKAQTKGDSEVLVNFKLRLEDGTILDAPEVNKDQVEKFRDRGLNPAWFVREDWMRDAYGLRGATHSPEPVPEKEPVAVRPIRDSAPTSEIIGMKDELIAALREETAFLRESLQEQRLVGKEDRELTKQLHILLKNLQDRLLPEPDRTGGLVSVSTPASEEAPVQPAVVREEKPGAAPIATRSRPASKPKPRPTRKPPKQSSRKVTKKKSARKPPTKKSKWNEMPTFKRFFSRS